MGGARESIREAFRSLVEEKPYRSITVSDICERAHVSRKSFYVHFENKEDVVASLLRQDVVDPIRGINELFSPDQTRQMQDLLHQKVYEGIYANRRFYRQLVGPMQGTDDTFIRVATNAIYDLNRDIMRNRRFKGDAREADYIAYFFASSQAMLIQKWICDDMPYTPAELASLYTRMTCSYWSSTF